MVTNIQDPSIACGQKLLMLTNIQVTMNIPKALSFLLCKDVLMVLGSSDVLTTAVTTLATSLAVALQPSCSESSNSSDHKSAGLSTPPHHKSGSPVITPVRATQLKTTYITQIKELHSLLEIEAVTPEWYEEQRDSIIQQMDKLNPKK